MQKNVPKYTPDVGAARSPSWAEASKREVSYALCNDRRTLLWFANQRAVEYHPTLCRVGELDHPTHLVLDLDPPEATRSRSAVPAAQLVRQALADAGLAGRGEDQRRQGRARVRARRSADDAMEDVAAATRALAARAERLDPALATTAFIREDRDGKVFVDSTRAGGATVVAAYSPRVRPGVPVSFPVAWDDLDRCRPADFTVHTALAPARRRRPVGGADAGAAAAARRPGRGGPRRSRSPGSQAMHEGKRRAKARRGE